MWTAERFENNIHQPLLECKISKMGMGNSSASGAKIFLTSKFSFLFLSHCTHKIKTATANGERLLIATHLDQ
jgi:hypothetical protein